MLQIIISTSGHTPEREIHLHYCQSYRVLFPSSGVARGPQPYDRTSAAYYAHFELIGFLNQNKWKLFRTPQFKSSVIGYVYVVLG